jgi:hypothetical protein
LVSASEHESVYGTLDCNSRPRYIYISHIFEASTAQHSTALGHSVLLVTPWPPPPDRASEGGNGVASTFERA